MAGPLGYRGKQVLTYIERTVESDGRPPSYQMIANDLGIPKPDVCNVIRRLEHRGYLRRRSINARRARGWHQPVVELTPTT